MKHEKKSKKSKKNNDQISFWKGATVVLAILLLFSVYYNFKDTDTKSKVDLDTAATKALGVVNNNLLDAGATATVVSKTSEAGLHKLQLSISGQKVDLYISPDASLIFPTSIDLNNPPKRPVAATSTSKPASVDDDAVKGNKSAKVTIIEFSDFECPFCGRFYTQTYKQLVKEYVDTGKVKYVFRDFPLNFHKNAQKASEAAECADDQGLFWEMHDKLFENQQVLDVTSLKKYAKDLGANTKKFDECLDSGKYYSEVQKDLADGQASGVSGTPAFFVNGKLISGAQPFSAFKSVIDAELAKS